jgi:hypothetical protein
MLPDTIHYYKTISGAGHFAETGVVRTEDKLGQYLRLMRFCKKHLVCLYLDNPDDFKTAKELFHFPDSVCWQDVYFEKI